MAEWSRQVPLGSVTTKIGSGATPRGGKSVYVDRGASFIRSQNVYDFHFEHDGLVHIDDAAAAALDGVAVQPGDVLLNITGDSVARCCLVPDDVAPARVSQHVMIVRPDSTILDSRYLQAVLVAPNMKAQLLVLAGAGATRPALTKGHVAGLQIDLPPLAEQRAIAHVLGALDDKIESNRRVVALCDESWMSVLKSEEQGEWVPLSTLAKFVNGRAFTKGASGDGRMVIRIAELNSGPGASTVYSDADVSPDHLAGPGDLLFAWSGSLTVARWYRDAAIVNQHIFKVLPDPGIPMWLVHGRILDLLDYFRGVAADKATTMGHIQRHHLDELVLVPARTALAKLDDLCGPLWRRALKSEQESLRLGALRETLLPKLLSGELRVRDAESLVEEAV